MMYQYGKMVNASFLPVTYIWWSPLMTSNNNPLPYVVSASSYYSTSLAPWMAFDGIASRDGYGAGGIWSSKDSAGPSYVQIDLGKKNEVFGIKINPAYSIYGIQTPPNLYISGSNDGENWKEIIRDTDVTWAPMGKYSEFMFDKSVKYRYFRFGSISVYSSFNGRTGYGDIQFYRTDVKDTNKLSVQSMQMLTDTNFIMDLPVTSDMAVTENASFSDNIVSDLYSTDENSSI